MNFTKAKPIKEIKPLKKSHYLLYVKIIVILLVIACSGYGVWSFINTHEFRTPIILQNPVPLKEHKLISPMATGSAMVKPKEVSEMTDEEYIKFKFGINGNIAIAIVKAESGLKSKINAHNSDGSIDIGCWQVNSVHLKKYNSVEAGKLIETLMDCKKATDWVYDNIYTYSGFSPWVAFQNGSYLAKL